MLGNEAFDAGWGEGAGLTANEAAGLALGHERPLDLPTGSPGERQP